MGRCHLPPWWYFWGLVNGQPFLSNFELFNDKICFTSKRPWYLNLWKQICEWSGVRFWPPGPVRFSVSSVGQPLFLHQLQQPLFLHQTQEPGKKTFVENIRTVFLFYSGLAKVKGCGKKGGYFSWLLPFSVGLRLNFITSTKHQQQNVDQTSRLTLIIRWKKMALITEYSVQSPLPANQPTVFSLETQKC